MEIGGENLPWDKDWGSWSTRSDEDRIGMQKGMSVNSCKWNDDTNSSDSRRKTYLLKSGPILNTNLICSGAANLTPASSFLRRDGSKVFASQRHKCSQGWDPSLQQKYFSCHRKKGLAPNPADSNGGLPSRALEQTLPHKEAWSIIYLFFKTEWLKRSSGPVCVMAEVFHFARPGRNEMITKCNFCVWS